MSTPASDRHEITGWFDYTDHGWRNSFTVVDDDRQPFALDDLKRFQDRHVRITIEATDPGDGEPSTL